jgi:hypothetical protein
MRSLRKNGDLKSRSCDERPTSPQISAQCSGEYSLR